MNDMTHQMNTADAEAHAGPVPEGLSRNPNFRLLADVPVRLSVEVGAASLRLNEVLDLGEGSVVELDRQADELLDIKVNGSCIARGEVVCTNGRFGIRLIEVASEGALFDGLERRG